MKLLRLSRFLPPKVGGLEFHVAALSRYQAKQGHQISVLHERGDAIEGVCCRRVGEVKWVSRFPSNLVQSLAFVGRGVWAVRGEFKQWNLIHSHGDIIEMLGAFFIGRRSLRIHTLHGGLSRNPLYRWIAARIFRLPHLIFVVSDALKTDLISLGISQDRIKVVSSGIDMQRICQHNQKLEAEIERRYQLNSQAPLITTVARLHPVKGLSYFVQAARRVLKKVPTAKFLIIGDGPMFQELAKMCHDEDRIILAGNRRRDEIYAALRLSTVYVNSSVSLPSLSEGTPTSLLEAMAVGLPLVATRGGGNTDLLRRTKGGILVEEKSPKALAKGILSLLGNPDLCLSMGNGNKKMAHSRDWKNQGQIITAECCRRLDK